MGGWLFGGEDAQLTPRQRKAVREEVLRLARSAPSTYAAKVLEEAAEKLGHGQVPR